MCINVSFEGSNTHIRSVRKYHTWGMDVPTLLSLLRPNYNLRPYELYDAAMFPPLKGHKI